MSTWESKKSEVVEKGVEENEAVDNGEGVQGTEVSDKGGNETVVDGNGKVETEVVDKAGQKTDLVDQGEEDIDVEID